MLQLWQNMAFLVKPLLINKICLLGLKERCFIDIIAEYLTLKRLFLDLVQGNDLELVTQNK